MIAVTQWKVTVAIVTYNHMQFIRPCLDSILGSAGIDRTKVVVVDNCSSDGSADLVYRYYPQIELIRQSRPCSFAANNNIAFSTYPSEYLLMLNPDTVLLNGALNILIAFMDTNPRCGVCGPQLVYPNGDLQYSCRRFPGIWSTVIRRTPIRLLLPARERGRRHLMMDVCHDRVIPVDWMLGAALLIRRSAFAGEEILDEHFPLYCEDIDLCRCLWKQGWGVYYVPEAKIMHYHLAKSDQQLLCRETWLHGRSMMHFVAKHYVGLREDATNIVRWQRADDGTVGLQEGAGNAA